MNTQSQRPAIKGQTVLVTGGAGFIGSHLVDALIAAGAAHVVAVDNMFLGSEDNLREALATGKATLYKDDIEFADTLAYVFDRHKITTVFNCATKALNYSFLNPANAFTTNVTGVINLLELQRKGVFKTLCHFSTSEVYGTAVYEPMDEAHPKNPTTTYAAGKAAADLAVESYVRMFDVDAFIVRPFNNYGPRQNHKGLLAGVIPLTAWRILHGVAPEIHGDGTQSRDFIYVKDTVDAVVKLYGKMAAGESVNISTDNQVDITTLITKITQGMGYTGAVVRKPARKADVECHHASNEKVRQLIDFNLTPFDKGLEQTLTWYKANIAGTHA
jgi:UDP-glucose 4-epimerase